MDQEEDEQRRIREKEMKKAEVRKRLEAAAEAKRKKGFMTADRKKKLRNLLRAKAAEELKKEMERRALERKRMIIERSGKPKNLDVGQEELIKICQAYHERIVDLENIKYDLQFETRRKDMILAEFNTHLNDLKGKFVKPTLKKVPNYELKLEKMKAAALKVDRDYRGALKKVKSGVLSFNSDGSNEQSTPQPTSP